VGVRRRALEKVGRTRRIGISEIRVSGLEKWHGRVVEVDGDSFTAELVPETPGVVVLADFRTSQLGGERVRPGDVVYVTARMVEQIPGYQTTTSAIRLRRVGNWSEDEVESIAARARIAAQEFAGFVGGTEVDEPS
jgi:hypothetical protein